MHAAVQDKGWASAKTNRWTQKCDRASGTGGRGQARKHQSHHCSSSVQWRDAELIQITCELLLLRQQLEFPWTLLTQHTIIVSSNYDLILEHLHKGVDRNTMQNILQSWKLTENECHIFLPPSEFYFPLNQRCRCYNKLDPHLTICLLNPGTMWWTAGPQLLERPWTSDNEQHGVFTLRNTCWHGSGWTNLNKC